MTLPLAFGGGAIGNLNGVVSDAVATETIVAALAAGLRHFDTAPHYGQGLSERRMGDGLRGRDDVTISTKAGRLLHPDTVRNAAPRDGFHSPMPFHAVYDYSADAILRSHDDSLQRLGLARVDTLLVHDIGTMTHGDANTRHWEQLTKGGGLRALAKLRDTGTVARIGIGVNEIDACLAVMREIPLDTVLIAGRYTLLDQQALDALLAACLAAGTRVIAGAPFNSGILATGARVAPGAAPPYFDYAPANAERLAHVARIEAIAAAYAVPLQAAALQFPLGHPAVGQVLAGFRDPGQVASAIGWIAHPIPADFWAELKDDGLLRADAPVPATIVPSKAPQA